MESNVNDSKMRKCVFSGVVKRVEAVMIASKTTNHTKTFERTYFCIMTIKAGNKRISGTVLKGVSKKLSLFVHQNYVQRVQK